MGCSQSDTKQNIKESTIIKVDKTLIKNDKEELKSKEFSINMVLNSSSCFDSVKNSKIDIISK